MSNIRFSLALYKGGSQKGYFQGIFECQHIMLNDEVNY